MDNFGPIILIEVYWSLEGYCYLHGGNFVTLKRNEKKGRKKKEQDSALDG
jgi:hypothetical protein